MAKARKGKNEVHPPDPVDAIVEALTGDWPPEARQRLVSIDMVVLARVIAESIAEAYRPHSDLLSLEAEIAAGVRSVGLQEETVAEMRAHRAKWIGAVTSLVLAEYSAILDDNIAKALATTLDIAHVKVRIQLERRNSNFFKSQAPKLRRVAIDNAKERARQQLGDRRGPLAEYDLSRLANHYGTLSPMWSDLKARYRKDATGPWRDLCRVVASRSYGIEVPPDLLDRLEGHDQLRATEQRDLKVKGHTPTPGAIALEHAARLCGAPPYHYALSTLKFRVKRAKQTDTP